MTHAERIDEETSGVPVVQSKPSLRKGEGKVQKGTPLRTSKDQEVEGIRWPRTVSIAGHKIKVKFLYIEDAHGLYKHDDRLIEINKGLGDRDRLMTLRHEMMEASLFLTGVGFSESYEQEPIVRCMEDIFFPAWGALLSRIKITDVRLSI